MTTSQITPNQLQPEGDDGLGPIIEVNPRRRAEAIERLLGAASRHDPDHTRRFIQYAQAHRIDLNGLWSRLDARGSIESTVLAVPSPGRTAMIFASRPTTDREVWSLAGLIDHACQQLTGLDVNLAQALLDPGDSLDGDMFRTAGFIDLAVLSYLERSVKPRGQQTQPPQWPADVTTTPFNDSMRHELLMILAQSYQDTMDCPGLQGYRRTEDILEGHRASGLFDPALWTILRVNGVAAGVLLLNPSADHRTIELVYLGLVKWARGRGLGTQLLRHGLLLLQRRRERTITLAVDEANVPAIALYQGEGFRLSLRRAALIRPLRDSPESGIR